MRSIHLLLIPLLCYCVLMAAASYAGADEIIKTNQEQPGVAIDEMQRANYFSYVMLIKIAGAAVPGGGRNVTFLMPKDKTLAAAAPYYPDNQSDAVAEFLLRHSIPSPLLFQDLHHFPTGSTVPTSKPGLVLRITNNCGGGGRRCFFLNNVRITSPDICTAPGSSIRCHGIDGIIQDTFLIPNNTPPPPHATCQNNTIPPPAAAAVPSPPVVTSPPTATAPIPPKHSSSSGSRRRGLRVGDFLVTAFLPLLIVVIKLFRV